MKHWAMFITLVISSLYIDMYQDRTDKTKTVIVIEKDDITEMFTINNSELNNKLVDKLVKKYETSVR